MEIRQITADTAETASILYVDGTVLLTRTQTGIIEVNTNPVCLTRQERAFLLYLIEGQGCVQTKAMMLARIGIRKQLDHKLTDVIACKIRKKLRSVCTDAERLLVTVRGRGHSWGTLSSEIPADSWHPLIPNTTRWTAAQKFDLISSLIRKKVRVEDILAHHPNLSFEELCEWNNDYHDGGMYALYTTRPNIRRLSSVR